MKLSYMISQAIQHGEDITQLYNQFKEQLTKLHEFMDMYLERVGERMSDFNDGSAEWKLYEAKSQEYTEYAKAVRICEHYIAKQRLGLALAA